MPACTRLNLRNSLIVLRKILRMTSPISSIRNLGPAYEDSCAQIGINSTEELREHGADETYRRLLQADTKPHFIGY